MSRKAHWEGVYGRRSHLDVSWYQERPERSLAMIDAAGSGAGDGVIDVGGGASVLVDHLLDRGFTEVSVLDISDAALAVARQRLGERAAVVEWIESDITHFEPPRRYRLWHDRAVFHFLTDPADRRAYVDVLDRALADDGEAVFATFAIEGPQQCSDLDVVRYDADKIAAELAPRFALVATEPEIHRTPAGKEQAFNWFRFQRA